MNTKRMLGFTLPVLLAAALAGCQVIIPFVPERILNLFLDGSAGAVGRGEFTAIQVDPRNEDSSGPAFVTSGDVDGDGMLDLATAWNESKPLQIHFQRRVNAGTPSETITFETVTLAGDFPITIVSGLEIADMDGDGRNDIVAMIKDNGTFARCRLTGEILEAQDAPSGVIIIFFGPDDAANATNALAWEQVPLSQTETAGASPADPSNPEAGGFTSMALADIDGQDGLDIVVAFNANDCEGGGNRVEYYVNPGPDTARQSNAWAAIPIDLDAPPIKWVATADIDRDGDVDIVSTYPTARGQRLRWHRNPTIDVPDFFHISDGTWQRGTVGQIEPGIDVIAMGDIDNDGIADVVARSTAGQLIVWFKGPQNPTTDPIRGLPWQVFTIAEFNTSAPRALKVADLDGDGQLEVVASAAGALVALAPFPSSTVFEQWDETLIIDDEGAATPALTDPNVDPSEVAAPGTIINGIEIVDLDGDGLVDIIGTLDRRGRSGVTNDAVIWFRNNGF
ncbi:MAG: VCBS repeat-containing protein [Phycisphaerae bacterium]